MPHEASVAVNPDVIQPPGDPASPDALTELLDNAPLDGEPTTPEEEAAVVQASAASAESCSTWRSFSLAVMDLGTVVAVPAGSVRPPMNRRRPSSRAATRSGSGGEPS